MIRSQIIVMDQGRIPARISNKVAVKPQNSHFTADIEKWESLAQKTSSDADRAYAQNIVCEHTMNSLRMLQKEIVETNWMFDSFES